MKRRGLLVLAILICVSLFACSQSTFLRPAYNAQAGIEKRPQAKSLILFIGDGMGPEIISIAKVYSEKARGADLNVAILANAGRMGMATTYSSNKLVTDSAAGATALATGSKTNNGMVGTSPDGTSLVNLLEKAVSRGKAVGVVTTTSITDATPGAFLAHASARGAQFDIAAQIIESDATVIMGGGKTYFLPSGEGKRTDGRDLADEARKKGFDVVFDKEGLDASEGKRILGLFADADLPYASEPLTYEAPSIKDMLDRALRMLTGDPDGFVLIVEGGRIDHAEHDNNIGAALGEFFAFDAAISDAMEYQQSDSTLTIVVTADHDTGAPALTSTDKGYPPVDGVGILMSDAYGFVKWISGNHTGTMVPIFARGPGEDMFAGIKDNTDVNRGIIMILGL